jgi:VanZ family protein
MKTTCPSETSENFFRAIRHNILFYSTFYLGLTRWNRIIWCTVCCMLYDLIQEVLSSNIGEDAICPNWGSLWVSSSPSDKCQDAASLRPHPLHSTSLIKSTTKGAGMRTQHRRVKETQWNERPTKNENKKRSCCHIWVEFNLGSCCVCEIRWWVFYPSTQRHYRTLILLYHYTVTCFGRTTIFR